MKIASFISASALGVAALLALGGCQGPSLVGQWKAPLDLSVTKGDLDLDIKADGTWVGYLNTGEVVLPFLKVPGAKVDVRGNWKMDNDKLVFSSSMAKIENPPAALQTAIEPIEKGIIAELNRFGDSTVKFAENTATITTTDGKTITLTRAASATP
jgi:hypothetical protein